MYNKKDDLLDVLDGLGLMYTRHSYQKIPADPVHRFATWSIPRVDFSGADLSAFERVYSVMINIFYKSNMTDDDDQFEADFEEGIMEISPEFSKSSQYDSSNNLFITSYTFDFYERM